jgi:hypothetical protein
MESREITLKITLEETDLTYIAGMRLVDDQSLEDKRYDLDSDDVQCLLSGLACGCRFKNERAYAPYTYEPSYDEDGVWSQFNTAVTGIHREVVEAVAKEKAELARLKAKYE